MSKKPKSKRKTLIVTGLIAVLLVGWLAYLRKVEGGLSNVFSWDFWANHWNGLEYYRPSVARFTRGNEEHRDVCLTFDDGPHVKGAPRIMDVLKKERIHGTFFVVGLRVKEHPELVKRMIDEGNEVGNHTEDHIRLDTLPIKNARAEIRNCEINVERACGRYTRLFRPPGMRLNHELGVALKKMGYTTVDYNVGARDFIATPRDKLTPELLEDMNTTPSQVAERVLDNVKPGVIILLHDNPVTAAALPTIVDNLKRQGYGFLTVTEMMAELKKPVHVVANPVATDKYAFQKMPPVVPPEPKPGAIVAPALKTGARVLPLVKTAPSTGAK